MSNIIARGTTIPTKKSQMYTTSHDYQKTVDIKIFEGERPLTKDNHLLGEFQIEGIPSAKKGVPQIEVTFALDENSILTVNAKDKGSGVKTGITITNDQSRLNKDEIEQMIKESEKFAEHDKRVKEKIEAKSQLEKYISSMKTSIDSDSGLSSKLSGDDVSRIEEALSDA